MRSTFNKWLFTPDPPAYPGFWKEYLAAVAQQSKPLTALEQLEFVVLDTETSGLNTKRDCLLSIGAVRISWDNLAASDGFECVVGQPEAPINNQITIHEIVPGRTASALPEPAALEAFVRFLGGAVLVGHHLAFDVAMLNQGLQKMGLPKLQNRGVDTFNLARRVQGGLVHPSALSLDNLCVQYNLEATDRHTAIGDAFLTALLFMKLVYRLKARGARVLKDLLW